MKFFIYTFQRDPNYNQFVHCRNSYQNVSSAYTPPSSLKSPESLICSKAPNSPKYEAIVRQSKVSTNQSLLGSASGAIKNIDETTRALTSLPFHTQRRSMLVSGLGSLSGSSGCMADRSMSSPAPSNEPDSPVFSTAYLAHSDIPYLVSPKNSVVAYEPPQLTRSSDHSGENSKTEMPCTHQSISKLQDKTTQLKKTQTNYKVITSKNIGQ